jgi:hypothetical protein
VGDRIINPKGRPRAPRFTERDRQAVLAALAGAFDEPAQKAAIKVQFPTAALQDEHMIGLGIPPEAAQRQESRCRSV